MADSYTARAARVAPAAASHVSRWLRDHSAEVKDWRRRLHRHPELSHEEFATTDLIVEMLESRGLRPRRLPGTGVLCDLGPAQGPRVAFRADIDALPIPEDTGLPFASSVPRVSHACGHDVHATILLALGCALADFPLPIGVRLIFQPAEEVLVGGATEVIAEGALDGVDVIYAFHVEPKLKVGSVGVRTGAITSATDMLTVTVTGPGGHSSRPHFTSDVVYGLGQLITQLPGLLSRRVDPRTGTVLVFGAVRAGSAANAIPRSGSVTGTIRTADIGVWRTIEPLLEELVAQVLAPTGCGHTIRYQRGVPPVLNDDVATARLVEAIDAVYPHTVVSAPQSSGGEDFSWYLEHVPGSMARLGAWSGDGEPQDLHRGDLRVDEGAIDVGVRIFAALIDRFSVR